MANITKLLGNKIRELRKGKKWSIEELADRSDLHFTYISRVELAKQSPTTEVLDKIAQALEIKTYELLKFTETEQEKIIQKIASKLQAFRPNELQLINELINRYFEVMQGK